MAVNKVIYDGETLVDLTNDTVTPGALAKNATAHSASGEIIEGTMPIDNVRYGEQSLTDAQKQQARTNIGAVAESHSQDASTITAGTFAGQVVANSSGQTPGTKLIRNSKLVSAEETPTVNGEICWVYS